MARMRIKVDISCRCGWKTRRTVTAGSTLRVTCPRCKQKFIYRT